MPKKFKHPKAMRNYWKMRQREYRERQKQQKQKEEKDKTVYPECNIEM